MHSTYLNIHGVGLAFHSNSRSVLNGVRSELRHLVARALMRRDKLLYFWTGNPMAAPKPLQSLWKSNDCEVINGHLKSVVDYDRLHTGLFAAEHFRRDEAILACVSLINYATRFTLFRRSQAVGFHAAAFAWRNRGVLLPGGSGSGKTTLAYYFTRAGFKFLTDEDALLAEGARGVEILGLQRRLRLDHPFFDSRDGRTLKHQVQMPSYRAFGEAGYCLDLRAITARPYQRRALLACICMLENEPLPEPELTPLGRGDAVSALIQHFESVAPTRTAGASVRRFLQQYNAHGFKFVEQLAERFPVYRLRFDLERHEGSVPGMVKSLLRQPRAVAA